MHGLLANAFLQSRNVLNKSLLALPASVAKETLLAATESSSTARLAQHQQLSATQQPAQPSATQRQLSAALSLLFLSFALALPLHVVLQYAWALTQYRRPAFIFFFQRLPRG